jgi:hypothetical protein
MANGIMVNEVPQGWEGRVLTAPLAVIMVGTEAIGKLRSIRVNEQIQRGRVIGLGSLTPQEAPATGWSGSVTCDFYNIDFRKSQLPGAIFRNNVSKEEWLEAICLQLKGVSLNIYQRTALDNNQPKTPGAQVKGGLYLYATIDDLLLDAEGFDLSEGAVSGRNQSFQYLSPILFKG